MKKHGRGFKPVAFFLIITLLIFSSLYGELILPQAMADQTNPASTVVSPFTDLAVSDPIYPYAVYLNHQNIIEGFPDGTFHGEQSLTRAQMAVLLYKTKKLGAFNTSQTAFNDIGPEHWAYPYVAALVQAGILDGFPDGTFRPEEPVSRAQCAALLLRLTSASLNGASLPAGIQDVDAQYWASQPIAASLNTGIMEGADANHFNPEDPATRAQVARGLSLVLNLAPDLRETIMSGILVPIKGEVSLQLQGGIITSVTDPQNCPPGSIIKTGNNGEARLEFSDGSSILIKENTELAIVKSRGQSYIKPDGASATMIDGLEIKLNQGRIFGGLAAGYFYPQTRANTSTSSLLAYLPGRTMIDGMNIGPGRSGGIIDPLSRSNGNFQIPSRYPSGAARIRTYPCESGLLPLQIVGEGNEGDISENDQLPWWKQVFSPHERLTVDMPWGVAGVRGTIWSCFVGPTVNIASVLDGRVEVRANGKNVNIQGINNYTEIRGSYQDPQPPGPMTLQEKQEWAKVTDWLTRLFKTIQLNAPYDISVLSGAGFRSTIPAPSTSQQLQAVFTDIMTNFTTLSGKTFGTLGPVQWASIGALDLDRHYIASDQEGNVYSSETSNNLVDKFDARGNLIAQWGGYGSGDGQFDKPQAVAVDSAGKVYVADQGNNRIEIFNSNGAFISKWGEAGMLDNPRALSVDADNCVYVVHQNGSRIAKFTADGTLITEWGGDGSGSGKFQGIGGIAVDTQGMVYVSDEGNNRIQKFDAEGKYLRQWGTTGSGEGQLNTPEGIALDTAGNVYVADAGNRRIQEFDSNGSYLAVWDLSAQDSEGRVIYPQGITIDPWNNIFVAGGRSLP